MAKSIINTVTYAAGCQTCVGLGVQWSGTDAKATAMRHARQTGHKGIWYDQTTVRGYNVTDDLTMDDWDDMERTPPPVTPPILISDLTLGRRIRTARRAAGLTQAQLAERLGMSRPTYIAIEQGERRIGWEELSTIAGHIETTVDALTTHAVLA